MDTASPFGLFFFQVKSRKRVNVCMLEPFFRGPSPGFFFQALDIFLVRL